MDALKKALDRFRIANEDFLGSDPGYSVGYGLDPQRKGPPGIIVFAMHDDENVRNDLVAVAEGALTEDWEAFPIYIKGMSLPFAR